MTEIRFTINDIAPSANSFYSGMHPMVRRKLAHAWHGMVIAELKRQRVKKYAGEYPVDVEIFVRFGRKARMMDSDNCFMNGKFSLDAMVQAGIIVNDSPRYVRSVRFIPERSADGRKHVLIVVRKAS